MNEKISMLMDGELDDDEAMRLLSGMKQDEAEGWHFYHLIGDAIRDPEGFRADLDTDCFKVLEAEPTVLAPYKSGLHKAKVYAWSAAASFAAVALVGWVALQNPQGSAVPKQVAQAVHLNVLKARLNDYLLAHQEFSPESEMMTSNIRTVSDTYQENGR
ncbi:MAG TPA: sigma-E factor negative regulatory protein [Burkholderiales bacterium]|nr:sigma-E factor negative regulatory protein [Burkholderiales bacterium]